MKQKKIIYLAILFAIGIVTLNSCSSDDSDNCTEQTWYEDSDGDSFGNLNSSQESCTQPTGYVYDNSDFDDINTTAYPGADEICDDDIDNNGDGDIDECSLTNLTAGEWTDNFGVSWVINSSTLTSSSSNGTTYVYQILVSEGNHVICLNDSSNPFNADLYSKFVFTNIETNEINLCQPYYDSVSQAFIENSTDPTDPDDLNAGCGGFAWSLLTRD